jgi:hypothetical protein
MMSEYLAELDKIAPFSIETESGGSFSVFHLATMAGVVKISRTVFPSVWGIEFSPKNLINLA